MIYLHRVEVCDAVLDLAVHSESGAARETESLIIVLNVNKRSVVLLIDLYVNYLVVIAFIGQRGVNILIIIK